MRDLHGDIELQPSILIEASKQIENAKNHWENQKYSDSFSTTICALHKLNFKQRYLLNDKLTEIFPSIAKKYGKFTEIDESLGFAELAETVEHWVNYIYVDHEDDFVNKEETENSSKSDHDSSMFIIFFDFVVMTTMRSSSFFTQMCVSSRS